MGSKPNQQLGLPLEVEGELFHAQTGLTNDRPHRSRLEVAPCMHGNHNRTSWIARIGEYVVATDDPVDDETGPRQSTDDVTTVGDRQTTCGHDQAATVTRRISGCASLGMARPLSRR